MNYSDQIRSEDHVSQFGKSECPWMVIFSTVYWLARFWIQSCMSLWSITCKREIYKKEKFLCITLLTLHLENFSKNPFARDQNEEDLWFACINGAQSFCTMSKLALLLLLEEKGEGFHYINIIDDGDDDEQLLKKSKGL